MRGKREEREEREREGKRERGRVLSGGSGRGIFRLIDIWTSLSLQVTEINGANDATDCLLSAA